MNTNLKKYINSIINININDELKLYKKDFYKNSEIMDIFSFYNYNNHEKNKLYLITNIIIKLSNVKLQKINTFKFNFDLDKLFFHSAAKVKKENVEKFSNVFLNFFNYKLNLNEFIEMISIITYIKYPPFFSVIVRNNDNFIDENNGREFYKYGLCDKLEFPYGDLIYEINERGKKFLKAVNCEITDKEAKIYSGIINYNIMNKYMTVQKHLDYYQNIMSNINDNSVKAVRLHKGKFKYFFEEYDTLIKFAYTKYGDNVYMKFCGNNTNVDIKHDGLILNDEIEEKIEITSTFLGKEEIMKMKELNHCGMTTYDVIDHRNRDTLLFDEVSSKIDKKRNNNNYDSSVTLVVMFDKYDFLMNDEIKNISYFETLFFPLKQRDYIFKNVYILLDEYNSSNLKIKPRIVKIK